MTIDEKVRNSIEGKFGVGKRSFSIELVMTLLSETTEFAIAITFKVMNLSTLLKEVLSLFLCFFFLKAVLAVILVSYLYTLAKNNNKNLLITFLE